MLIVGHNSPLWPNLFEFYVVFFNSLLASLQKAHLRNGASKIKLKCNLFIINKLKNFQCLCLSYGRNMNRKYNVQLADLFKNIPFLNSAAISLISMLTAQTFSCSHQNNDALW